jgi:hypothetical protein
LSANDNILQRINEIKAQVAERVISAEVRRRTWRVHEFQFQTRDEELAAIEEGCRALRPYMPPPATTGDWKDVLPPPLPEYPKTMFHPGYPNGAATGLLMKDYRGKNAEQVIWKFDGALEAKIMEALKQAAIEEGQWSEKREVQAAGAAERKARINRGRDRLAAEKAACLARGEVWR